MIRLNLTARLDQHAESQTSSSGWCSNCSRERSEPSAWRTSAHRGRLSRIDL